MTSRRQDDGNSQVWFVVAVVGALALAHGGCTRERPLEAVSLTMDPPALEGAMAPRWSPSGGLLSWLEPDETADGSRLVVAEWSSQSWSEPSVVARGEDFFVNWADLPLAVESAMGARYAFWLAKLGEDTYAYGVQGARSSGAGATWERLGWLHDDISATEHGFVSAVPLPDGGVQVFWLDGRRMLEGGSMQLRTTRVDDSVQAAQIPASAELDARVCECCSTAAALTTSGPIVAYRDRSEGEIRDIAVVRAVSAGGWSEPSVIHDDGWEIQGCPVNGPAIAAAGDQVVVAWFTGAPPRANVKVAFSSDGGATFGPPTLVDDQAPLGRVDVVLESSGRAVVSWLARGDNGGTIRWRWADAEGGLGPPQQVTDNSGSRSAGVPRLTLAGSQLALAWVDEGPPSRLRSTALNVPGK